MIETQRIIGGHVIHLPSVDSTNLFAIDLLANSKPAEGTVVSTDEQTRGRGQSGSSWQSEAGKNAALSVILYPTFLHPREQFYLSQIVSLAIWDALHDFLGDKVRIKWPNDIYVNDKKICGILIQNSISSHKILSSIIGIGLNINQQKFSKDLPNPTSLIIETGEEYPILDVLQVLYKKLNQYYLQLQTKNFALINTAYMERLYRFGEIANFQDQQGLHFSGAIEGTSSTGKLKINTSDGVKLFSLKEVKYLN